MLLISVLLLLLQPLNKVQFPKPHNSNSRPMHRTSAHIDASIFHMMRSTLDYMIMLILNMTGKTTWLHCYASVKKLVHSAVACCWWLNIEGRVQLEPLKLKTTFNLFAHFCWATMFSRQALSVGFWSSHCCHCRSPPRSIHFISISWSWVMNLVRAINIISFSIFSVDWWISYSPFGFRMLAPDTIGDR